MSGKGFSASGKGKSGPRKATPFGSASGNLGKTRRPSRSTSAEYFVEPEDELLDDGIPKYCPECGTKLRED
jgi:hypothetical protein